MEQRLGRVTTTQDTGEPLDRIFVHDYVLEVEIGVHHNEKGVTQRVRFSVDIDVTPTPRALQDDIERTLDYDYVINGIKTIISRGHINLVETLAEDVADMCLSDPRVRSARVRVEKLDAFGHAEAVGVELSQRAGESDE